MSAFAHSVGVARREDTVTQTCINMKHARISAVVICGGRSAVEGIFTERDALKVVLAGGDPSVVRIGDVMTARPQSVTADVDNAAAMKVHTCSMHALCCIECYINCTLGYEHMGTI